MSLVVTGWLLAHALLALLAPIAPTPIDMAPPLPISKVEDIEADLALVSCSDDTRYDSVSRLFNKAGARAEDLSELSERRVRNLVVRKAGASAETIVIGAHYDKTASGCGVVDNWTGITILSHIYKTLRPLTTKKSYVFVAFDREEEGLRGSRQSARDPYGPIPSQHARRVC